MIARHALRVAVALVVLATPACAVEPSAAPEQAPVEQTAVAESTAEDSTAETRAPESPVPEPRATRVHDARHRIAEELAPLARSVLGDEGVAIVDGNSVVLVGAPDAVATASEVLFSRDVPQQLVTLHLEVRSTARVRSAGYSIRWQDGDELRAGRLHSRRPGRSYETGRDEHTGFSLRVRDGATGRIDLGESLPVLARGFFFGGQTTIVEVASELFATPRILGDGDVSVELSWSRQDLDDVGRTAGEDGSTTLLVAPGEVAVLGSISRRRDAPVSGGGDLFSLRSQSRSRSEDDEKLILLRIEVD